MLSVRTGIGILLPGQTIWLSWELYYKLVQNGFTGLLD